MKACLVRWGIRNFKPTLRQAPEQLEALRTPEGMPLPPNTLAEMRRDLARLHFIKDQIKAITEDCVRRLDHAPSGRPQAMNRMLARVVTFGIESVEAAGHSDQ